MDNFLEKTAAIMIGIIILLFVTCLLCWPVEYIWNDLAPSIFGLRKITFGEAFELLLFCQIVFVKTGGKSE